MKDESVIVVGAGSVGLVTALGLARAGVSVRVLEASDIVRGNASDPVYHWSVLAGLERLGVLADLEAASLKFDHWGFLVRETRERVTFEMSSIADEVPHPFNLHLGQRGMTRILTEHLSRYSNVEVEWGTAVTHVAQDSDGVTVVAEAADGVRSYRSGWVVGADGSRSIVRREIGLAFAGMTWPDRFVATNLRFDLGSLGFAPAGYQIDPQYGAVVASVDSGLWRYIHAEDRLLPEAEIADRVREILTAVLPDGVDPLVQGSHPYRIHQRSADRFRVGRVILVGDAAHLTNPTNGLGMTSGLFDAYSAVEALTAVLNDTADEAILDRYSDVRRRNFWEFSSPASTTLKEFVFPFADVVDQTEELQRLRSILANRDRLREYLLEAGGCATPSLLSEEKTPS